MSMIYNYRIIHNGYHFTEYINNRKLCTSFYFQFLASLRLCVNFGSLSRRDAKLILVFLSWYEIQIVIQNHCFLATATNWLFRKHRPAIRYIFAFFKEKKQRMPLLSGLRSSNLHLSIHCCYSLFCKPEFNFL